MIDIQSLLVLHEHGAFNSSTYPKLCYLGNLKNENENDIELKIKSVRKGDVLHSENSDIGACVSAVFNVDLSSKTSQIDQSKIKNYIKFTDFKQVEKLVRYLLIFSPPNSHFIYPISFSLVFPFFFAFVDVFSFVVAVAVAVAFAFEMILGDIISSFDIIDISITLVVITIVQFSV